MYNAMLQSGVSADAPVRIPGPDSDILKTLQTILGVLSIYWKPLQTLVGPFDYKLNVRSGLTS